MGRMLAISLAVLTTPMFLSQAKAEQAYFRQSQDAVMAAAAGPEFQRTGFATVGLGAADRRKLDDVNYAVTRQPPTRPAYDPGSRAAFDRAARGGKPLYDLRTLTKPAALPQKSNFGTTPSTLNFSGSDNVREAQPDPGAYSAQIEARGLRIFPWASQEQERQQWMADQEQRAIANEINRTQPLLYPVGGR